MKHMRKGIALLLAAMMVMPNMPASAENVQSETQTEEVADVTETTEKAAQNVEETQVQEEIESADDASVFYNTGNYEVGIMEDDFAEDGSYTINIPEENPFFPYEVQFTCDGEVTDEWFMTPDDTVEIGGHTFKVSAYFDNTVVTQMSLNVAGDTVTVYPEKKEFTNDGDGTMEMSLLPLTQRNLTVDLTGYTPIELTMVSTDSIFTGADALKDTDASISEAQTAGSMDVKDDLFRLNGKEGYKADYSQGVDFTIFVGNDGDLNQETYHYTVKTVEGQTTKPNYSSNSTSVDFTGLMDQNGNFVAVDFIQPTEDSYAEFNYLTITVFDDTDLSKIAPCFNTGRGVSLYAENGNSKEVSGMSYHDFSNGPVQYTAVAEDGKASKNYWLQVVKRTSGNNLYVNSLADTQAKTVNQNGVIYSIREVMLDGYHNYYHDIVLANMGTQSIPNLKVELNSDQVVLDQYWTLSGNYELSPLGYDNGSVKAENLAKIRLKPKDGVEAGTNVSGTVTIKSGETALMVLTLTGMVGDPSIITKDIPAAVKYVPYGTVIQNNNKYSWNKTSYTMVSGTLPAGMVIRENGEIYGVPQETGEFTFTVQLNNSESSFKSDEETYTLKVLDNTNDNVENATDSGYELRERLSNVVVGTTGADSQNFVSIGDLDEFQSLYLDGQELTKGSDYSAERGSTRITISTQTLSRGGKGSHTIALEFRQKDTDTLKRAAQNYIVSDEKANSGNNSSNGNSGNSGNQTSGNSGSSNSGSSSGGSSTSNVTGTNGTVSQTEKDSQIATQKTITYTVAAGDTLSKIALKMYGDRKFWRKIYADNKDVLKNPNRIYVGQKLTLYFDQDETQNQSDADSTVKANTYVIKPGDTLWKIATKLYKKGYYWKNIYEANRKTIKSPEKIRVGQMIELP